MNDNQANVASKGGIGFLGLLAVAFIVLKLTGVIAWSWWWVLTPLWLPVVVLFVGCLVLLIALGASQRNPFQ